MAATLNVPLYVQFYEEMAVLKESDLRGDAITGATWVEVGGRLRELRLFAESISRMGAKERNLLMAAARQMAKKKND